MSHRALLRSFAFLALVLSFALVACPGPTFVVQQYRGPQRPQETIAVLRANGSDPARLAFLDDEDVSAPLERDSRLHIELLPGRHTVVVVNAANQERSLPVAFHAEANKVYRVRLVPPDDTARVFEVNRSSDAVLADVTLPPEPPASVAPSPPPKPSPPEPDAPNDLDAGQPTDEPSLLDAGAP